MTSIVNLDLREGKFTPQSHSGKDVQNDGGCGGLPVV